MIIGLWNRGEKFDYWAVEPRTVANPESLGTHEAQPSVGAVRASISIQQLLLHLSF